MDLFEPLPHDRAPHSRAYGWQQPPASPRLPSTETKRRPAQNSKKAGTTRFTPKKALIFFGPPLPNAERAVDRPLTKNPLFFPRLGVSAPWTGLTESSMWDLEKNRRRETGCRKRRIPGFRGDLAAGIWASRPSTGYAASVERSSHSNTSFSLSQTVGAER